ncbi:hypothetical protein BP5796_03262 [Coleophoma crateriformis]|uniref:Copper-fist domain-containing protein n=1 Tax=Coleophoma crateriformis TaxID=565419 RepID=A0A3D8SP49_9HELO|nr:hypothetical protein BP5796_03262 [Coleophoma crateriformis]
MCLLRACLAFIFRPAAPFQSQIKHEETHPFPIDTTDTSITHSATPAVPPIAGEDDDQLTAEMEPQIQHRQQTLSRAEYAAQPATFPGLCACKAGEGCGLCIRAKVSMKAAVHVLHWGRVPGFLGSRRTRERGSGSGNGSGNSRREGTRNGNDRDGEATMDFGWRVPAREPVWAWNSDASGMDY